jgi:hypothetical protein
MGHEIADSLLLRASLIVKREASGNVVPEVFKKSAFVTPKQFFHVSKAPITLLSLYRRYNTVYQAGLNDAMDIMLKTLHENRDAPHETKKLLEKAINQIADELLTEQLTCAE